MTNILRIDASARGDRSITRRLTDLFVSQWLAREPDAVVTRRDVGLEPPPAVSEAWIAAAFAGEDRTEKQRALLALSDELIAEVESADVIVIGTPMYNYGMPSALKAWFDQIIRIDRTFSFDLARGDRPLEPTLSGKALAVLASWGEFGFDPGGINATHGHLIPHIRSCARYLGADVTEHLAVEYQEFRDERHEASCAATFDAVPGLVDRFQRIVPGLSRADTATPATADRRDSAGDTRASLRFVASGEEAPAVGVLPGAAPLTFTGRYIDVETPILDARSRKVPPTLDRNGFTLRAWQRPAIDFDNDEDIASLLYPVVEETVAAATGASRVLIFDHTIRRSSGQRGRAPARSVHVDYTPASALRRLAELTARHRLPSPQRVVQVNLWTSIAGPVERHPLALLDAETLDPSHLVHAEIHFEKRVGENFGLRHDPAQAWYFYPNLSPDEALLIKGYDSQPGYAPCAPHSAFEHPATPSHAPARESVEVRTFAIFD